MADEPSNGELAWRIDDARRMLRDLVGRDEYNANQQSINLRFADQGNDIQELRRQHDKDVEALHTRIDDRARSGREGLLHWRVIIFTGLIPALISMAGVFIALHK